MADTLPPTGGSPKTDDKLTASCHCGRVKVQMPSRPKLVSECHCTVCYKYGALWAYFTRGDVAVTVSADDRGGDAKIETYVRDDPDCGIISFNRCGHCGCMTHWLGLGEYAGEDKEMGVNCRMVPEAEIADIPKEVTAGP